MRIALLSASKRTDTGELRAELSVAGRSVLAWQVDWMRNAGAERIICLAQDSHDEVLRIQREAEREGVSFHVLRGFAAVPALVRAEDDLIVLCDGLLPDPACTRQLWPEGGQRHFVASIPNDTPIAAAHEADFERIDATCLWAGLLVMRGAGAARLSDFPADADAISLLLRLALQAHTPRRSLGKQITTWFLAASAEAAAREEQALIARSADAPDWRAPFIALSDSIARKAAAGRTNNAAYAGAAAASLFAASVAMAAYGLIIGALGALAAGMLAAQIWRAITKLTARLRRRTDSIRSLAWASGAADVVAALVLLLALAEGPGLTPLAILGPILIGLVRLAETQLAPPWATLASDRAAVMFGLALAALAGGLAMITAVLAASLMIALLRRASPE